LSLLSTFRKKKNLKKENGNNKENEAVNNEMKMEFEISAEKFFNNSNRNKKLCFHIKENTDNVFRVKRNRCELIEKINNNFNVDCKDYKNFNVNINNTFNHQIYNSDCIQRKNSILRDKDFNIIFNDNNNNRIKADEQQGKNSLKIHTARRLDFDCNEVDNSLNLILQNLSNTNMLNFHNYPAEIDSLPYNNSIDNKQDFSFLIHKSMNENNIETYSEYDMNNISARVDTDQKSHFDLKNTYFSKDTFNIQIQLDDANGINDDRQNISFQSKLRKLI
jgi:hypothetical protein